MKLKVVCLNLWEGGRLLEEALDFITKNKPDILALQEVYDGHKLSLEERFRSLDTLKKRLRFSDYSYAPEFIDNRAEGKIPQGNAVFSMFPVISSSITFFDRQFDNHYVDNPENYSTISRNLQHVVLGTEAGQINIFNFHGVWDLDGDNDSLARRKMVQVILDAVVGKEKVILMGDTNAKPTNPAIQSLEKSLMSVFGNSVLTTFNMRRKDNPGYASAAVDMMFVSGDIQVHSSSVPKVDISDHLPLVAELSLT